MTVWQRALNIAFSFDCFLLSVLTLGGSYPSESISSSAYRAEKLGMFWGKARPVIDLLLGQGHCEQAYRNALNNIPPDERA